MAATHPRSRYTRPLKATHTFISGAQTSCNRGQATSSPGGHALCSSLPTSPSGSAVGGGRREINSPERRNQLSKEGTVSNPRRSSSMGSLSDPDPYWAMSTTALKSEGEGGNSVVTGLSHKRSNSLSSADHISQSGGGRTDHSSKVHTCMSIEGLNQEVSWVLEGEPSMMSQHPDGHIAPVGHLMTHLSMGGTPPHHHTLPLSQSPYPTPHTASHHHNSEHSADPITGNQTLSQSRGSPATLDYIHHHPSSPKPSFAREPPDGAERCVIRQETRLYSTDFIQKGPDRSKANIIFKGTVFAPLLTTPSMPVSGIQC
ncbi:uncharacterized protein LOC135347637 isoform X2 [Halichondria panicea]|uniref:uncharacterized protein LOC135347637 isoform X2 n=1 Tax=Halichondria panicea TaxID=6063 RepID=UPI00312B671B